MTSERGQPKRILFITSNRLGDAILSTAVLAHFIDQNPGAEITLVCGKVPAPLFRAVPGVIETVPVEKEALSLHWLKAYTHLFGKKWDLMIDLRNVGIMRLLPAGKRVIGGAAAFRGHKLEEYASLLGSTEIPPPVIWLDEQANSDAEPFIPSGSDALPGPIIALGATTGPKRKRWRPENYAAVVKGLAGPKGILPGTTIVLFGAPNERDQADAIIKLLPDQTIIDMVGKTDVLTTAAALARCSLFVGVDSGLMHLAAALDVATLGIFGEHGEPQTYRPWGSHVAHVHRRNADWTWEDRPSAMDGIKPDEVIKAAEELAKRAGI